jgi:hypothetical protein
MSNTGGIRAGRAFVEIFGDDSALQRTLKASQKRLEDFGKSVGEVGKKMALIGSAALAPMLGAVKIYADMGDQMTAMSKRTGVSVEALSELGYAAKQSGTSLESVETGIRKMQKTLVEAKGGNRAAAQSLAALGLTVQDLAGMSPDQQFEKIATRLAAIRSPAVKAAAAMEIFGKGGAELIPMMEGGGAAIEALRRQARDLGLSMSTSDAAAADALGDSIDTLKAQAKMLAFSVGATLAPAVSGLVQRFSAAALGAIAWVKSNQDLVVGAFKLAAGLAVGGASLLALSKGISGVGLVFKGVSLVLSLIASPVALVVGALAAIGAALAYAGLSGDTFSAKMQSLSDLVMPAVAAVTDFIRKAWDAVSSAMAIAGQAIMDAVKAAWDFIAPYIAPVLTWLQEAVITALAAVTFGFTHWRQLAEYSLVAMAYGIVRFANQAAYFFTQMIPAYLSWFADNWRDVFTTIWNGLKTFASNVWTNLVNLWTAIKGLFAGEGWSFQWTGLMDGFVSTIKELPQVAEREIGPLEKSLSDHMDELGKGIAGDWQETLDEFHRSKVEAPEAGAAGKLPAAADAAGKAASNASKAAQVVDAADDLQGVATKMTSGGIFNAAAIASLSGGTIAERTAKASEQTAKGVEKLVNAAQTGGLVFG